MYRKPLNWTTLWAKFSWPLCRVALLLPRACYYPSLVASLSLPFLFLLFILVQNPGTLICKYIPTPQVLAGGIFYFPIKTNLGAGSQKLCAEPLLQLDLWTQLAAEYKHVDIFFLLWNYLRCPSIPIPSKPTASLIIALYSCPLYPWETTSSFPLETSLDTKNHNCWCLKKLFTE